MSPGSRGTTAVKLPALMQGATGSARSNKNPVIILKTSSVIFVKNITEKHVLWLDSFTFSNLIAISEDAMAKKK